MKVLHAAAGGGGYANPCRAIGIWGVEEKGSWGVGGIRELGSWGVGEFASVEVLADEIERVVARWIMGCHEGMASMRPRSRRHHIIRSIGRR